VAKIEHPIGFLRRRRALLIVQRGEIQLQMHQRAML
jgi:hypothetical protein